MEALSLHASLPASTDLTPPCTPSFHVKERKMI
ncbi:hypothetical protein LEMLEM_LOCUS18600, partial [Lemmus lemmus]